MQTTAALLTRSHVRILGGQPTLEQPSTILGTELEVIERQRAKIQRAAIKTYASLLVEGLNHQHEWRRSDLLGRLLVHNVQGRLVNQTDLDPFQLETHCSVIRPVQHLTEGHDVSGSTLEDGLILSRHKLVAIAEELRSISLQDVWNLGTVREAIRER